MKTVALLTDFGSDSWYVGIMRAVIASYNTQAGIIDLGHEVPAGSVKAGAFYLREGSAYLPDGCVICAVVDPGVGGARRIVMGTGQVHDPHTGRMKTLHWVGPDNGLFSWLRVHDRTDFCLPERFIAERQAGGSGPPAEISGFLLPERVSATFHGRDVFAPLAAQIAGGLTPAEIGQPATPFNIAWPAVQKKKGRDGDPFIEAKVIAADHFGNLLTNLSAADVAPESGARLSGDVRICRHGALDDLLEKRLPLNATFSDVPSGEWVAYFGSSGLLELAVRDGSARADLEDRGLDESMLVIRFVNTA